MGRYLQCHSDWILRISILGNKLINNTSDHNDEKKFIYKYVKIAQKITPFQNVVSLGG
jgi:hypothetical protein